MEKFIYDENNGLWYEKQGDYYSSCLKLPDEKQKEIGVWGIQHLLYIKQERKVSYLNLWTSGKLHAYPVDVDSQAEEMLHQLIKQKQYIKI